VERAKAEAIYDAGREAVVEVLLAMDHRIQQLEARVARQDERIAELERRLNRSSQNSSQPPSADGQSAPARRGKDSSHRAQGAQSGHEGKGTPAAAGVGA
jgi:predicted RNase H-like nuclease (RuvC/YqgF family)